MRTLVDIPEDDIRWLDAKAAEEGKSRTALVRDAVASYRAQTPSKTDLSWLEKGFGLWKDRTDIVDGLEYQRRMRAEWTRPWDDDYEEVKAEYPDLFTEYDDRERAHYLRLIAERENRPGGAKGG